MRGRNGRWRFQGSLREAKEALPPSPGRALFLQKIRSLWNVFLIDIFEVPRRFMVHVAVLLQLR